MYHWHIITGEYAPQAGGVGDYTRQVATELAKVGDTVEVWTSGCPLPHLQDAGVTVHRLPGHFGPRALGILERATGSEPNSRILVQYVPHAFGFKAMNVPFCCWLLARRRRDITVMFHEVAFPRRLAQPLAHNLLGEVTSVMARLVARAATRILVASSSWEALLRPMVSANQAIGWLPVPSNVPVVNDRAGISAIRSRYTPVSSLLVGHFGTYGHMIAEYLEFALPAVLCDPGVNVVLLGRHSEGFRNLLARRHPRVANRLHATNGLGTEALSVHLSACDLMVQPYPDGISTRRGSAMAALSHGRPVVSTRGALTEAIWTDSRAVELASCDDMPALSAAISALLKDDARRERLGYCAQELYLRHFDISHTIAGLRAP